MNLTDNAKEINTTQRKHHRLLLTVMLVILFIIIILSFGRILSAYAFSGTESIFIKIWL